MAGIEEASWTHVISTYRTYYWAGFFTTSKISINLNQKAKGDPTHHQGLAIVKYLKT